jgi:HD-like signal output (HDOD) protein
MNNSATLSTVPVQATVNAVSQLKYLALPATASRCLRSMTSDEDSVEAFCSLVESDPALSSRLIGIANSAFFALPRPVWDARTAVLQVLGLNLSRNLTISMALSGCFNTDRCPALDLRRYWATALANAEFAVVLNSGLCAADSSRGMLHLCGLLRSLGLLTLAHVAPEAVQVALTEACAGLPLSAALTRHVGINQREALDVLLPKWGLPPLVHAVCGSTGPNSDDQPDYDIRCAVDRAHLAAEAWWAAGEDWDGESGVVQEHAPISQSPRLLTAAARTLALVGALMEAQKAFEAASAAGAEIAPKARGLPA